MSYFANNIKLLRKRKHLSQDAVAKQLELTRSSLSGYENSTAQAPYEVLIKLSEFYNISIDLILKKDLSSLPEKTLLNMEDNGNYDIHGKQLRTLVTTANDNLETNGELVPIHALSVYNSSLHDPEFIGELPLMKLPFLSDNRQYRAFPVTDDSMHPVIKGSYVIGEYYTDWSNINDGDYYIVVTESRGVTFKQLYNNNPQLNTIQLCSNDPVFEPFDVKISEIKEIWKFVCYIGSSLEENNYSHDHLIFTVKELQRKMTNIEKYFKV